MWVTLLSISSAVPMAPVVGFQASFKEQQYIKLAIVKKAHMVDFYVFGMLRSSFSPYCWIVVVTVPSQ